MTQRQRPSDREVGLRGRLGRGCFWIVATALFATFACAVWRPAMLGRVMHPLVVPPPEAGLRSQMDAVVVEGWDGLRLELARDLAENWRGRPVYLLMDRFDGEDDKQRLNAKRWAASRYRLSEHGIDPGSVTWVPVDVRGCRPGCTRLYADTLVEELRSANNPPARLALLSPGFHSQRSCRIYRQVLASEGLRLSCYPADVGPNEHNWWRSVDGLLMTAREWASYGYYAARGFR